MTHVREQYQEWLLTDQRTRRAYGAPLSKKEFAERKGVSERSLRRWELEESFQQALEERRAELAKRAKGDWAERAAKKAATPEPAKDPRHKKRRLYDEQKAEEQAPALSEHEEYVAEHLSVGSDPGRAEYESVRDEIARRAGEGDAKALELYMRFWGSHYAEQEAREQEAQFQDLSDDELVSRTLSLLGRTRVREWLSNLPVEV